MCMGPAVYNRLSKEPSTMRAKPSPLNKSGKKDNGNAGGYGLQYNTKREGRRIYCISPNMSRRRMCRRASLLLLLVAIMGAPAALSAQTFDEPYIVMPTPILRSAGGEDLTTVLLVNNEGVGRLGDSHGRFLSVRPELGLLTSTARTFIQEGVTTEYATQVVGTTLNNGRLYAQYLKKSSRVLFENDHHMMSPSVVTSWVGDSTQTRSYLQSHNDLLNADSPDWQEIDDKLLLASAAVPFPQFVGNTDFINIRSDQISREVVDTTAASPKLDTLNPKNDNASFKLVSDTSRKLAANKVLPLGDLQTFTVKNHFEPSGYQSVAGAPDQFDVGEAGRSAKGYHQVPLPQRQEDRQDHRQALNVSRRLLSTVTYYGFADFTTLVGDSLIVFLPSTIQASSITGHVTSIKGKATLSTTLIKPTTIPTSPTLIATADMESEFVAEQHDNSTAESPISIPSESTISPLAADMGATPALNLATIATVENFMASHSASTEAKPMFSLPTDQEIQEIYASLAKGVAQATNSVSESQEDTSTVAAESNLHVHGGATTIFIDDDPFANFVEPTSIQASDRIAVMATATETGKAKTPTTATTTATAAVAATEGEETTTRVSSDETEASTSTSSTNGEEEQSSTAKSPIRVDGNEFVNVDGTPLRLSPSPSPSPLPSLSPIVKEINKPEDAQLGKPNCAEIRSQVFLTQLPKSDSVLDTALPHIPFDIQETTKYYCIEATQVLESASVGSSQSNISTYLAEDMTTETTLTETTTILEESITELALAPETGPTPSTVSEHASNEAVTESENENERETQNDNENENDNEYYDADADEDADADADLDDVDLIYKTLYTTYTYLTTFFQGESTTISSHTEVVTNVVTSTLSTDGEAVIKKTESAIPVIGENDISATRSQSVVVQHTTANATPVSTRYMIPDELESLLYSSVNEGVDSTDTNADNQLTAHLDDSKYTKTFYTTYTYYTTIFADSETEIMSRTEVFSNYVTELVKPTRTAAASIGGQSSATATAFPSGSVSNEGRGEEREVEAQVAEKPVTLVTDVRTSSSGGAQQVIGRVRDQDEDQVSSESNTEEIIPSATLLLQTSFTTFTFYTTMYVGDDTNVVSRLETVTNIATETLQPTRMLSHEDTTLPITYFTTFTYWTKLAKDGEITTISREETISNVIEPSKRLESDMVASIPVTDTDAVNPEVGLQPTIQSSGATSDFSDLPDPTTFYTTYTYYTTSYEANKTVTDSRFETVTNVVTPVPVESWRIEPTVSIAPQPVYVSSTAPAVEKEGNSKKDLLFYDYKHIIDADGVSTLYFTTQVQSSLNSDGLAIELTSRTSSLHIDESKKASLEGLPQRTEGAADLHVSPGLGRQYKTGLVRLIEGTRIGNSTTTLYQSKVIGTIIDNRYAQIIESTSSFLFEKAISVSPVVAGVGAGITSTQQPQQTQLLPQVLQSSSHVEGSVSIDATESAADGDHSDSNTDLAHDDADSDSDKGSDNSNISSESKKRTFAPVIRPFASRNRPTFAPKQKTLSPSSATIITRSDITPTITATPALKSVGRYSSSRRGAIASAPILDGGPFPFSTSSRRLFGRPSKSTATQLGSGSSSFATGSSSSGFAPSKNRFASSSRGAPLSSSRRLSINASFRQSSSAGTFRASALNVGNSRQRLKPTSVPPQSAAATTISSVATNLDGSDAEQNDNPTEDPVQENNDEEEKSAQNARRNQNPLLRFRRPLNRPSGFTPVPRTSSSPEATISPRRNPLTGRARASTTTTSTTTTTARPRPRSFLRPTINGLQSRARPQNSLFPPRGLFQQQAGQAQPDNSEGSSSLNEAENDSDYNDDDDGEEDDTSDGGDGDEGQNEATRRRRSSKKSAKQLKLSRTRREADGPNRNRFRFRRPKTLTTEEPIQTSTEELTESTTNPVRSKINSRFGSRYQATHKPASTSAPATTSHRAIRPTRPQSSRTQFTLREKDTNIKSIIRPGGTTSNFRRQQSSIRRTPSTGRRLKSYNNNNNNNKNKNSNSNNSNSNTNNNNNNVDSRSTGTSRSRSSTTRGRSTTNVRGRNRNEYNNLDGTGSELGSVTITVTHLIPAEVTVPVVNGQVTEYKNIVTGKTSLEIVGPHQYTQIEGNNGQKSLFLTREDSSINAAGATELTRYLLHDTLTSTVTFTPTTIRGRKTSFSHILPSTVYSVENVVSTMQPQLAANAPLANILLSQLLLGNINLPSNPLLGAALGQPQLGPVATAVGGLVEPSKPVTEYRTHTSTYVTTIYDGKSTVLPITFQGKKILTTVFDTTAQTITATEYSVDTIINTPSPQIQPLQPTGQVAQVNSLLLQQFLLQQQQQNLQHQIVQTASPQIHLLSESLQDLEEGVRYNADVDVDGLSAHDNIDDIIAVDDQQVHTSSKGRKKPRKSSKSGSKRNKQQQQQAESSIVTLYVSGRRPGEFSTILSTVHNSADQRMAASSLHKRHAHIGKQTEAPYSPEDIYEYGESERVRSYVLPLEEQQQERNEQNSIQDGGYLDDCGLPVACGWQDGTATLESIVGDVDLWHTKATRHLRQLRPRPTQTLDPTASDSREQLLNSLNFLA